MLLNKILSMLFIIMLLPSVTACDNIPQDADSSTIDRKPLNYAYFVNDLTDPDNVNAPAHQNISEILALSCSASSCHGVGGNNGGTFKIYGMPLDTDAKNISNFISAQGQVIKGLEDTSPTVVSNNFPRAHTSPLLNKPLSEIGGGSTHKGLGVFTQRSEQVIIDDPALRPIGYNGSQYGEIYRWIAFTP